MPIIDPTFTASTELRIIRIEEAMTAAFKLLLNTVNREQFNRLNLIRQKSITSIESRLDAIDTQIDTLMSLYNDLL
jgi:hypothetical protein